MVASQFSTLPSASSALAPFSLSFFVGGTGALTLSFADFGGNPTNSTDGFVDNVSLTAAPEPSSLAVLALGALFCVTGLRFRRASAPRG